MPGDLSVPLKAPQPSPFPEFFRAAQLAALDYAADRAGLDSSDSLDAKLAACVAYVKGIEDDRAALLARLARAEADTKRIDWLDAQWQNPIHLEVDAEDYGGSRLRRAVTLFAPATEHRAPTTREAIDLAAASRSGDSRATTENDAAEAIPPILDLMAALKESLGVKSVSPSEGLTP